MAKLTGDALHDQMELGRRRVYIFDSVTSLAKSNNISHCKIERFEADDTVGVFDVRENFESRIEDMINGLKKQFNVTATRTYNCYTFKVSKKDISVVNNG